MKTTAVVGVGEFGLLLLVSRFIPPPRLDGALEPPFGFEFPGPNGTEVEPDPPELAGPAPAPGPAPETVTELVGPAFAELFDVDIVSEVGGIYGAIEVVVGGGRVGVEDVFGGIFP